MDGQATGGRRTRRTTRAAQPRAPRLADVARLAGVSAQTVSNVLNGRTGFGEETRQRVLAAAEELQFRPNRAARQLRTRRSQQIGLHVPEEDFSVTNPWTVGFTRALISAAERAGQSLVVFTHRLEREGDAEELVAAGVDGFILCNIDPEDPRPRLLAGLGSPLVVFGRPEPSVSVQSVDIDNVAAIAEMVDYLVERGHRSFGFVGYSAPEFWNLERFEGARDRLAEHGLDLPEHWVVTGDYERVRRVAPTVLLGEDRPDAVVCASDSLAAQLHGTATRLGLVPGRDLAITGFDGLPTAFELDPPLTTVAIPVDEAAQTVVELLLEQVEGTATGVGEHLLRTAVRVGGSA